MEEEAIVVFECYRLRRIYSCIREVPYRSFFSFYLFVQYIIIVVATKVHYFCKFLASMMTFLEARNQVSP